MRLGYGGTKSELERLVADASELTGQALDPAKFSDIITAIHAVQENLGITGTTAKEASSTIQGSVNTMKAAWENWLTALGRSDVSMTDETRKLVDSVVTVMKNLVPRVGEIIGTLVTEFGKSGPRIARELWNSLEQAMPAQARPVMELIEDIFDSGFAEIAAGSVVAVSGVNVLSKAVTALKPVANVAQGALGKLSDGLLDLATSPKTATTALGGLASTVLSIPSPMLALAAVAGGVVVTAIGAMAAEAEEAERRQKLLSDATESASDVLSGATGPAEDFGDSLSTLRDDAEDALQSLADLNAEVGEDLAEAFAKTSEIDGYVETIDELANQSELSVTQQEKLKQAVDGYNSIVGTQYEVVDAVNGKIADQNGQIQENTDQIDLNAESWKKRAAAQALSNAASKYMEQEAEDAFKLQQAQDTLADATARYNDALRNYNSLTDNGKNPLAAGAYDASIELGKARDAMNSAQASVDDLSTAYESSAQSASDFNNMSAIVSATYDRLGDDSYEFVQDISDAGISLEDFASLTDEQMGHIVDRWDGSTDSIADAMGELTVVIPNSGYEAMLGLDNALSEGGYTAINTALSVSGMTAKQFSDKVSQYGIAGEQAITAFANAIASGDSYDVAAKKAQEAASGLGSANSTAYNKGVEIANSANSGISSVDTYSSGLHLGHNFAAGLIDSKPAVANAAQKISDTAAVQLRFSVPKKGPFSGAERGGERSGEHLVQNFARGMMNAIPDIEAASLAVSKAVSLSQDGGAYWGGLLAGYSPSPSSVAAMSGGYSKSDSHDQTIIFNQPVQTPDEVARTMRMQERYGLAGAR